VKNGAIFGANCTIVCRITIGQYAFIDAGAVVTKDVPAYALVVGSLASMTGWMCECGLKLGWTEDRASRTCGKQFSKTRTGISNLAE
jgi:UDP-2-acetamido-3-amino-2,3-dideoxy-glucuronate N-acetyltransferase